MRGFGYPGTGAHLEGRGTALALQGNGMNMGQDSIYQWGAWSCDCKWLLPWAAQPFSVQGGSPQDNVSRPTVGGWICGRCLPRRAPSRWDRSSRSAGTC